jgi:peptide/nickel transport system ATP-binding protein
MITHDLGVVADMADDMQVMYAGRAIEVGSAEKVFFEAAHPYTWGLLNSMPRLDQVKAERLDPIPGTPPSLINLPSGCKFHPRCGFRDVVDHDGRCHKEEPAPFTADVGHTSRCFLVDQNQLDQLRADRKSPAEETA